MNEVYIVWMEGVYMQGIYGVYDNKEDALDAAKTFIAEEHDDYHGFNISETPLGTRIYDNNVIYKITRKDTLEYIGKNPWNTKIVDTEITVTEIGE